MASSTTNLGLRKPDTTDNWSVQDDFNANMDKIDAFAGEMSKATKVTDLNNATGNNRIYYFDTGASNAPSAFSYGFVEVMAQGNNVHQTAVGRGGTDVTFTYERSRNASGTWGSWESKTATLNSNLAQLTTKRTPAISSLSSDTEILAYRNGAYQVALRASSAYLPSQWGTLIIMFSGVSYGAAIYVASAGGLYVRHKKNDSEWHNSWTAV